MNIVTLFLISVTLAFFAGTSSADEIDIAEHYRRTGLYVLPVRIANASGMGLLDTGATHVAFHNSENIATFQGFPLKQTRVKTQNGTLKTSVVSGVPFSTANLPELKVDATVGDLSGLSNFAGTHLDCVVGANYLIDKIVSLNGPHCTIQTAYNGYSGTEEHFNIDVRKGVPFVTCKIHGLGPQELRIDTGNNGAICLHANTIGLLRRMGHAVVMRKTISIDLSGRQSEQTTYVLRGIDFCGVTFANVPVTACEYPGIGMQILRRFRLAINFLDKSLWCQPRVGGSPQAISPNASGIDLRFAGADKIVVANVRQGYVADEEDILQDDEVISVNGKFPVELSMVEIENLMGRAGNKLRLRLRRGGNSFEVDFVTKYPFKYPPNWPPEREEFNPDAAPERKPESEKP